MTPMLNDNVKNEYTSGKHEKSQLWSRRFLYWTATVGNGPNKRTSSEPLIPQENMEIEEPNVSGECVKRSKSLQSLWDSNTDFKEKARGTHSRKRKGHLRQRPIPMENMGNTCYMNAVVQSLLVLKFFWVDLIEKYEDWKDETDTDGLKMTRTLVHLYKEFLFARLLFQKSHQVMDKLDKLKNRVGTISAPFLSESQQDAVEFLTLITGKVEEEFDGLDSIDADQNPIKQIFEMHLGSVLTCPRCNAKVHLPEQKLHVLYLSIPSKALSHETTLQDAVDNFFHDETIEHRCDRQDCTATEKVRLTYTSRLPPLLTLQLARYSTARTKRHEHISAPHRITLPQNKGTPPNSEAQMTSQFFTNDIEVVLTNSFILVAIICHDGISLDCGHYKAYVFQSEDQCWYSCNDEVIKESCLEEAQVSSMDSGYCYFYINEALFEIFYNVQ